MSRKSVLVGLVLLLGAAVAAAAGKPLSAAGQVAQMKRGVNIIGYDPLWRDPAKARFKPRHLALIKSAGFENVRMVLGAFRFMNDKN